MKPYHNVKVCAYKNNIYTKSYFQSILSFNKKYKSERSTTTNIGYINPWWKKRWGRLKEKCIKINMMRQIQIQ